MYDIATVRNTLLACVLYKKLDSISSNLASRLYNFLSHSELQHTYVFVTASVPQVMVLNAEVLLLPLQIREIKGLVF